MADGLKVKFQTRLGCRTAVSAGEAHGCNSSILVITDDPRVLVFLADFLEEAGYQVQAVHSEKLALISAAAQPPELILLAANAFQREELLVRVRTHLNLARRQTCMETLVDQQSARMAELYNVIELDAVGRGRTTQALRDSELRL